MSKPKLQIIVLFQNLGEELAYYARSPAPPLSGAIVAGLTPPIVEVELLHEMVRPIDYRTEADFIALSFMDFCAPHAIEVAGKFRKLGKTVVAGGRYPSTFPNEVIPHFDATVIGEAELVWPQVVEDLVSGKLQKSYEAPFAPPLNNIPPPRYDLVESSFAVPLITEATRGCKYKCSFCQLTVQNSPYRMRPIEDVINDLKATENLPFHKRKAAMLIDNNLGGDIGYAKELLREIAKLNLWGLGAQFSFDCLHDDEFLDLLIAANCGMAFIGLESLNEPSLASVHKRQNKVAEYRELFAKLKRRGILTFTGMMLALDEDTPEYYEEMPTKLDEIDPSSILLSISIPIPGTPFHEAVESEGRIFDKDLSHYEGDHLVFHPKSVTADDVFEAFERINRYFYSWKNILKRWWRFIKVARPEGTILRRLFYPFFITGIFFRLSIFQRDHAQKKVYPRLLARETTASHPVWHFRFWQAYWITMRPYLLFLSGASGLAGASFIDGPLWWKGILASFVIFFTYGFGQALTDVFQIDTDAISSPYRPLVKGLVTSRSVGTVSIGFMLVSGIILGLMDWLALLLAAFGITGLVLYTWFKKRWWGGPPWNSWIFALLAVIARVALDPAGLTVIISEPRFLFALGILFFPYANFVLVGYLKDLEADRITGYKTFPVVFGWKANAWLTDVVLLLATSCGIMYVLLSPHGMLPIAFLAVAVAIGAAGQIDQHRYEDPERGWIPTLFACRANLLFALLITAANRPHAWPFLAAYYGFFELVLRRRPEPKQI